MVGVFFVCFFVFCCFVFLSFLPLLLNKGIPRTLSACTDVKGDLGPTDGTSPAILIPSAVRESWARQPEETGRVRSSENHAAMTYPRFHIRPCHDARAGVTYTAWHRNSWPERYPVPPQEPHHTTSLWSSLSKIQVFSYEKREEKKPEVRGSVPLPAGVPKRAVNSGTIAMSIRQGSSTYWSFEPGNWVISFIL